MKSSSVEIARRYIDALFPLAQKAGSLDVVEKDLNALSALAGSDAQFKGFLDNPLLNRDQQKTVIEAIAKKTGAHQLTSGLLAAMADQKRLPLLSEVASQFAAKAEAARGEMSAEIVSATKLSAAEEKAIAERLGKAYGKTIKLTTRHDPSLIGGMIVKIGSAQLDGSLAGKLNRLNIALKAA